MENAINYMRKAVLAMAFILSAFGCNEDILDLKNPKQYTEDTYFVNATQMNEAINAVYAVFYFESLHQRGWYFMFDGMGNEGVATGSGAAWKEFYLYTYGPETEGVIRLWHDLYRMVGRANLVIKKLDDWEPEKQEEIDLKPVIEGQARCLRAWANFQLVRLWGRVPLKTDWEDRLNFDDAREDVTTIYASIDEDLSFASENLPATWDDTNKGRTTSGTALSLWGKTYLYRDENDKAVEKFGAVVENEATYGYGLYPDFFDLFTVGAEGEPKGENSEESVFEVQFTVTENISRWWWYGATEKGSKPFNAHWGRSREYSFNEWKNRFFPSTACEAFVYQDEADQKYIDPRASLTFYGNGEYGGDSTYMDFADSGPVKLDFIADLEGKRWYKKFHRFEYIEKERKTGVSINSPVIRYADVLLMYAEALIQENDLGTALEQINRVRRRAGAFEYTTLGDQSSAMDILKRERRLELAGEQHRFFDLVRWGELDEVVNAERAVLVARNEAGGSDPSPVQDFHRLFPIPQQERDVNAAITDDVDSDWN